MPDGTTWYSPVGAGNQGRHGLHHLRANPGRTYVKAYIDLPNDKLQLMFEHADPGGVGGSVGIDVFDNPQFYDWFGGVVIP